MIFISLFDVGDMRAEMYEDPLVKKVSNTGEKLGVTAFILWNVQVNFFIAYLACIEFSPQIVC